MNLSTNRVFKQLKLTSKSRILIGRSNQPRSISYQPISTHSELSSSNSHDTRSYPSGSSSSSPAQKKTPRLRDRAGLTASLEILTQEVHDVQNNPRFSEDERDSGPQDFTSPSPWKMGSRRTQAERSQMSHRERLIALELFEDLGVPLEQLGSPGTTSTLPQQTENQPSESTLGELLKKPEFQSVISLKSSSNRKSLRRHRPNELSHEDIRMQDMLKELADSQISKIDSLKTDFELIEWIDHHVFCQSTPQPSSSNEPTSQSQEDNHPKLGEVFGKSENDQLLTAYLESELDYNDPHEIMSQPLSLTPLFSVLLSHLIKTVSGRLKNPNLALYLFDWTRSHDNPVVKYFGLTKDVYFEIARIKWSFFQDLRGIENDLSEMKSLGLEFDDRFKTFVQSITQAVLEDEIQAEERLKALQSSDQPFEEKRLERFRKISRFDRQCVCRIESVLNDFIEAQNQALAHKFRVPFQPSPET